MVRHPLLEPVLARADREVDGHAGEQTCRGVSGGSGSRLTLTGLGRSERKAPPGVSTSGLLLCHRAPARGPLLANWQQQWQQQASRTAPIACGLVRTRLNVM